MFSALAWVLAILAIASQPITPPQRFKDGMDRRGHAVMTDHFTGVEWRCLRPYQDETCFAGLSDGRLITGP